jgi:hypothetical protein
LVRGCGHFTDVCEQSLRNKLSIRIAHASVHR